MHAPFIIILRRMTIYWRKNSIHFHWIMCLVKRNSSVCIDIQFMFKFSRRSGTPWIVLYVNQVLRCSITLSVDHQKSTYTDEIGIPKLYGQSLGQSGVLETRKLLLNCKYSNKLCLVMSLKFCVWHSTTSNDKDITCNLSVDEEIHWWSRKLFSPVVDVESIASRLKCLNKQKKTLLGIFLRLHYSRFNVMSWNNWVRKITTPYYTAISNVGCRVENFLHCFYDILKSFAENLV